MRSSLIETSLFARQVTDELSAEEYAAFQWHLSASQLVRLRRDIDSAL